MKTVVTAPAAQAIGSTKQLQAQAVLAFTEFRQLARRTVEQAWECGRLLTELKEVMEHGAWLPWLEENEIPRRTASHFMRLHHAYQMGKLDRFGSVDAALKALPPATPKALPAGRGEPGLTVHEKRLVERDQLVKENRELKVELQEAGNVASEKKQLVAHLESELGDGFARGRDVLEERQAEIRRLGQRIHELEQENGVAAP